MAKSNGVTAAGGHDAEMRRKLTVLLEKANELHAQLHDILRETQVVLTGGEGIGARLRTAEAHFAAIWHQRYGDAYVWAYQKDRPNMKRLLAKLGDEELARRVERFIRSDEQFYVNKRHPFAMFVATINSWARPADEAAREEIVERWEAWRNGGCPHDSRCPSMDVCDMLKANAAKAATDAEQPF